MALLALCPDLSAEAGAARRQWAPGCALFALLPQILARLPGRLALCASSRKNQQAAAPGITLGRCCAEAGLAGTPSRPQRRPLAYPGSAFHIHLACGQIDQLLLQGLSPTLRAPVRGAFSGRVNLCWRGGGEGLNWPNCSQEGARQPRRSLGRVFLLGIWEFSRVSSSVGAWRRCCWLWGARPPAQAP